MVHTLDRLGRNLREVLTLVHELREQNIGVRCGRRAGWPADWPTGPLPEFRCSGRWGSADDVASLYLRKRRGTSTRNRTLGGDLNKKSRGRGGEPSSTRKNQSPSPQRGRQAHPTANEPGTTTGVQRRTLLTESGNFVLGVLGGTLAGAAGGYGGALALARNPPGETLEKNSDEPPVRCTVIVERDSGVQGSLWIYPGILKENPALHRRLTGAFMWSDLDNRFREGGAVDAGVTVAKLIVEGRRTKPLRIIDIRPRILSRKPTSRSMTIFGPGPQGTGESPQIGFNLDENVPIARKVDRSDNGSVWLPGFFRGSFFDSSTGEVVKGSQEVYQIFARTTKFDVTWNIDLTVSVDGGREPVLLTVDINGQPIRTVATRAKGNPTDVDPSEYAEAYLLDGEGQQIFRRWTA